VEESNNGRSGSAAADVSAAVDTEPERIRVEERNSERRSSILFRPGIRCGRCGVVLCGAWPRHRRQAAISGPSTARTHSSVSICCFWDSALPASALILG